MSTARRLPSWFRVSYNETAVKNMTAIMDSLSLNTVCKEADCPNMGECYKRKTAAFMILGSHCTRHCRFCNVSHGAAEPVDHAEPRHLAEAVEKLGLKHAVITCVTRDDLADYGAQQFAETIREIRKRTPDTTIEVLISDFGGKKENLDIVIDAHPDILNHNVETVPQLYGQIRPEAEYDRSLFILKYAKEKAPGILTKTGIMVGLGEEKEQVIHVMEDVKEINCDIFTIGQYMQPSDRHYPMKEFVHPNLFEEYAKTGKKMGIPFVFSGPKVRSSYHAGEVFEKVR